MPQQSTTEAANIPVEKRRLLPFLWLARMPGRSELVLVTVTEDSTSAFHPVASARRESLFRTRVTTIKEEQ